MNQDKIWDYFQNNKKAHDVFSDPRQIFMVNRLNSNMTVLNIGVGKGSLETIAKKKGVDIYSLDPSDKSIEYLKDRLCLGDKAKVGYAQSIPFSSDKFDAVVMSEVLEHLDDVSLNESLMEVRRVLKNGGFLLASTPYNEELGAGEVVCPDCGKVFHRMGHVQSFDKKRIKAILSDNDLLPFNVYVTTFVDWKRNGVKNFVKSIFRIFLARMGENVADPHLIVLARK